MRREDSVASNCSDVTVKARPIGDGSERDVDSDVEQVEDGVDLLYTRHEPTAARSRRGSDAIVHPAHSQSSCTYSLSDSYSSTGGLSYLDRSSPSLPPEIYGSSAERDEWAERLAYTSIESVVGGVKFVVDQRYEVANIVGKGAYGIVCSAKDTQQHDSGDGGDSRGTAEPKEGEPPRMVAIKKVFDAFSDWTDTKRLLREIQLLRVLNHAHVLHLHDILPPPSLQLEHWSSVYLVTKLYETNLHRVVFSGQPLTDAHIQYIVWQAFRALRYLHRVHVIHRDIKPTNILLNRDCELCLADLGLARYIGPPSDVAAPKLQRRRSDLNMDSAQAQEKRHGTSMTKYVVTRWYRAPELLVQNSSYSSAVDMWSIGCILAEVVAQKALFPGKDSLQQLKLIIELIGPPTEDEMGLVSNQQAANFVRSLKGKYVDQTLSTTLAAILPQASPELVDLIAKLLRFNPAERLSAEECLHHPYLKAYHDAIHEEIEPPAFDCFYDDTVPTQEELRRLIWNEMLTVRLGHGKVPAQDITRPLSPKLQGGHMSNSFGNRKSSAETYEAELR